MKEDEGKDKSGWGIEKLPYPAGVAYIQSRWNLCIGCGICEIACSMRHFGVLDRELSRIRLYRYLTPLPKSVQNVCVQCRREERECEMACPLSPPAIRYDEKQHHMTVDADRCLGSSCGACRAACPAEVPHFGGPEHDYSLVCDLCEKDGVRQPQCVEVCPAYALEYMEPMFPQHMERVHPDEKARCLAQRLYPLGGDRVQKPPEEVWGGDARP